MAPGVEYEKSLRHRVLRPHVMMNRTRDARVCRRVDVRGEAGAVLILALVYLVSIGLVVTALATWATNDLHNTATFKSVSELHYAVSSTTNTAIQSIRFSPMPASTPTQKSNTPVGNCWNPASGSPSSQLTINGYTVSVWCSTYEDNNIGATRQVTLYACLSTLSSAQCQSTPLLTAVVVFDDYPPGGGVLLTSQCNPSSSQCGYLQTLTSWIWG